MELNKELPQKYTNYFIIIVTILLFGGAILGKTNFSTTNQRVSAQASQNQNPTTATQENTENSEGKENHDSAWNRSGFMLNAQDAIRSLLKAPATAEFPSNSENVEVGVRGVDNLFRLDSYVDSQNDYGANIRNDFIVEGIMEDGEPQKVIFVSFDGETIVDRTNQI